MSHPTPRWVVFDLDDTLIDRAAAFDAAWTELVRELGVDPACGGSRALTAASSLLASATGLSPSGLRRRLWRGIIRALQPDPSRIAWLRDLSRTHAVLIASNGSRRIQTAKLRATGLAGFEPRLVTSDELRLRKPDPAFFSAVFARFGADPARTLVVGNDERLDIEAAIAAGARATRVTAPTLIELRRALA